MSDLERGFFSIGVILGMIVGAGIVTILLESHIKWLNTRIDYWHEHSMDWMRECLKKESGEQWKDAE